jgi:NAD-dependent DNA ligase
MAPRDKAIYNAIDCKSEMHSTRIAAFLLGALLLGSVFMAFVATENFQTASQLLASPPPELEKMIKALGAEDARRLLRYMAGEENRLFFQTWETAELVLGVALASLLLLGVKRRLLGGFAGAVVILAAFQHFQITPELVWQGRSIDFVAAAAGSTAREHFMRLHAIYGVIETVKFSLLILVAVPLFWRSRRAHRHIEINAIDYADHRHVDG